MKIILILLLILIACNRQAPTDNQQKDKLKIPEDVILNTNLMNLDEVLKYCDVKIDSFDNDTTYHFDASFTISPEKAKSPSDLNLIFTRTYYHTNLKLLGLSYVFSSDDNEDFEVINYKIENSEPEIITAENTHSNNTHFVFATIKYEQELRLFKSLPYNNRVYVRFNPHGKYDHLMTLQQKNSILLMLRLIELKNYKVSLI